MPGTLVMQGAFPKDILTTIFYLDFDCLCSDNVLNSISLTKTQASFNTFPLKPSSEELNSQLFDENPLIM